MMRNMCYGIIVGVAIMTVAAIVDGQSRDYHDYISASGAAPPAIVIETTAPDTLQICISSGKGLVSCRSMGELRVWVADRTMQQQQRR